MFHSRPAEPLSHRKNEAKVPLGTTPKPLYNLFTSTPVSTRFKKPIFQTKAPNMDSQRFDPPNCIENQENPLIQETRLVSCPGHSAGDGPSGLKVAPPTLIFELSAVAVPGSPERDQPTVDNPSLLEADEEEEDQTVFFTPELFEEEEEEEEEGSPQKEVKPKSPHKTVVVSNGTAQVLSEDVFGPEQALKEGNASVFDGERDSALSVSNASAGVEQTGRHDRQQNRIQSNDQAKALSHDQETEAKGLEECQVEEQLEDQSRQKVSRTHRLSRSRQKAPCTPSGKLTNYFTVTPQAPRPLFITIDD